MAVLVGILAAIILCTRRRKDDDNDDTTIDPHDYYKVYGMNENKEIKTANEQKNLASNGRSWIVVTGGSDSLGL